MASSSECICSPAPSAGPCRCGSTRRLCPKRERKSSVGCGLRRRAAREYGRGLADPTSDEARPAYPPGPPATVTLHLPSRPDSPMTARHRLGAVEPALVPETMARLRLLVTELVANSV